MQIQVIIIMEVANTHQYAFLTDDMLTGKTQVSDIT